MDERYIERREGEKERRENGAWYPIAVGTSAKEEGELLWRPNRPKMGFFQNKAKPLESRIREHSGLEEDNQETYPASETSSIRTSIGINPISVFAHLSLVLTAPRKNPGNPTPKHNRTLRRCTTSRVAPPDLATTPRVALPHLA